jgi:hypothetical protein
MDLTKFDTFDLAALLGAADPKTVAAAEASAAFEGAMEELHSAMTEALTAVQRLEKAEMTMAVIVRGFFTRDQIEKAKWS